MKRLKEKKNPIIAANDCIDYVRSQTDTACVFLSLGKDSLVTLDMVYPKFKRVVCVFMYFVKGLEHIERWIRWAKVRYPNIEFVQIPHWNLSYILRGGMYCTPHPKQKLIKLEDVIAAVRMKHNVEYIFLGMKKADGMNRNVMLKNKKDDHYIFNGKCFPLAEFTQKEILAYMRIHDIPKPVIYSLALCKDGATVGKASSGVGFNIDCFKWLEDNFPGDLEKIYNVFPLSRRILFDYHGEQYK